MSLPKRIYLTGFMGAGKSTIGQMVANTLGYDFCDLDAMIVEQEKQSIPAIFREKGESYFRALERQLLETTLSLEELVVALGGGTLVTEEAWQLLDSASMVIYLKADPGTLARRLHHGRTDRPLALDEKGDRLDLLSMENRVRLMLAERESFYRQADIVVRSGRRHIGSTVDEVVRRIRVSSRRR